MAQTENDSVYQLDPFTAQAVEGYQAPNSIAGTRTNTPIRDIPLNLHVFTKDFSDDLLLTSQVDLERYNASMVNGGADVHSSNVIQQSFNNFLFRGFTQNWSMRDGVRQYDPIDSQGLERVEVVKGPSAALYGLSYPGGVMNSVSKSVLFGRNFTDLHFTLASEGEYRATIDTNIVAQAGDGQIGVRFNGTFAETRDQRAHSDGRIDYKQLNLAWAPNDKTKLELLYEDGYREKPVGLGTFTTGEVDSNGNALGNGASIPIQATHPDIPWDWNWSTETNVRSLEVEYIRGKITHSFADNFFVNGYYQYASRVQPDSNGLNASGMGGSAAAWDVGWSSQGGNATGWLNPNTPEEKIAMQYHYRDWRNKNWGYGATAVYTLNNEVVDSTFTLGANAWTEDFLSIKRTQPANSPNIFYFPVQANIEINDPIGPPPDYFVDVQGNHQTQDNSNDYYFASWQGQWLDGRLTTNIGINDANFKLLQWNTGASTSPDSVTDDGATSPLFGAVFDVTDTVSIFALNSTSLFPTTLRNDFQEQLPPIEGDNIEFGVKLEALDGKFSGTISVYEITQSGGGQRDPNAHNRNKQLWDGMDEAARALNYPGLTRDQLPDQTGALGDLVNGAEITSEGFEADIFFNPSENWQLYLSYANNTTETTQAINPALIGSKVAGAIKNQLSFVSKYRFTDGGMNGTYIGVGGQWADKAYQDTTNGVDRYNPETFYLEAFAGRRFDFMGNDASVRLNIKNITEQETFVGWKATGSSSTVATERYEVPVDMRLNLTFGLHF